MKSHPLKNVRLVLVAPRHPGNVGACARLAANFEIADWMVVDPQCDVAGWDARKFATGTARDCLDQLVVKASVREAVADCQTAIAFSRRSGKTRMPSLSVGGITPMLPIRRKIALVFGNEESGLSRDETEPCSHLCAIPTASSMASMNLSHAVAVVLARIYDDLQAGSDRAVADVVGILRPKGVAPLAEFEAMLTHWREVLIDLGLVRAGNPDRLLRVLRGGLERATLTRLELRALRGIFSRTQVALGTRRQGKRVSP